MISSILLAGCHEDPIDPWAASFGDQESQNDVKLAADREGNNILLAGSFDGQLDFGGGSISGGVTASADIFIGSLDASGKHRWSAGSGTGGLIKGAALDEDGNAFFVGKFNTSLDLGTGTIETPKSAVFVARFDPTGKVEWVRHHAVVGDEAQADGNVYPSDGIALGGDGSIVFGGRFAGTLDVDGATLDNATNNKRAFVTKLDASGERVFSLPFYGESTEVNAVAADGDGAVTVGGSYYGSIALGATAFEGQGHFVARLEPDGAPAWMIRVDHSNMGLLDEPALAIDESGDVFIVGCFLKRITLGDFKAGDDTWDSHGYVARISSSGTPLWLTSWASVCPSVVTVDDEGHVHVGGRSNAAELDGIPLPFSDSGSAFIAELDADGYVVRASGFGEDGSHSRVTGIAAVDGGLVVAGVFEGTLTFPQRTLPQRSLVSAGQRDIFVARF